MVVMAKKRKGGKHTTKRAPVMLPEAWDVVAQQLAERAQKPKLWHIIALLKKDAEEAGLTDLPRPPWVKAEDAPKG
jgi:hypothetical protein